MIKVGDTVKFIDDVGGGKVTSFVNKNMVNVEDENGFEIPYLISKLINTSRSEEELSEVETKTEGETTESSSFVFSVGERINGKDKPSFYCCFVGNNTDELELYLVNDSNFTLLYHYAQVRNDEYLSVSNGTVVRNSKLKIDKVSKKQLNDIPEYYFQLIYFADSGDELPQPIAQKIKINPVKLLKETSYLPSPFFSNNAYTLQIVNSVFEAEMDKISDEDFKKVVQAKESKPAIYIKKRQPQLDIIEVDLHLHELIDNESGLSNREKLEIQLEKVETEMQTAIKTHIKKVVFIHGVGQGVLKQEVANLLKKKFAKYYFQDASFREYGFGATMVTLRK